MNVLQFDESQIINEEQYCECKSKTINICREESQ